MALKITLHVPVEVEEKFRAKSTNLDADVRDAYALELFRQGKLSHYEFSQALGLDRFETDAYLKKHNVYEGSLTMEDLEEETRTLEKLFAEKTGK